LELCEFAGGLAGVVLLLEVVAGAEDVEPDEAPDAEVWPAAVSGVGEDCWVDEEREAFDCGIVDGLDVAPVDGVLALPPELEDVVPPESVDLDGEVARAGAELEAGDWLPGDAWAMSWPWGQRAATARAARTTRILRSPMKFRDKLWDTGVPSGRDMLSRL
jgi:hypothetical protein